MTAHPIVRIVFISLSALIILFLALFTTRQMGLSRNHQPLTLEFLNKVPVVILEGGLSDKYPSHSLQALEACYSLGHVPMIEIIRTADGDFALKNNSMFFTDFLKKFKNKPFVLNLSNRDAARYYGLKEIIDNNRNLLNLMAIYSPHKDPIRYMRKELPRTIISLNQHDLISGSVLASLYIEPMATLKGDLVIAPLIVYNRDLFPDRLVAELRRRHLKIILDFTQGRPDNITFKYDGYIATKPL